MISKVTQSVLIPWADSKARESLIKWFDTYPAKEVTLVVPPLALLDRPSLSVHLLQASVTKEARTEVGIFYANLGFGAWLGQDANNDFCYLSPRYLLSERLFAKVAYGVPLLGENAEATYLKMLQEEFKGDKPFSFTYAEVQQLAENVEAWVNDIAQQLVRTGSRVIGCTSIFEQTAASVAILNAIKRLSPQTITIIGGANCTGEMAEGIESLGTTIDYIFSGEGETAFPQFIHQVKTGHFPTQKILKGSPCFNLDAIPTPNYHEFYDQQAHFLDPLPINTCLPYESSRGCWWGAKHQCTFCGIERELLKYRQKSPNRVISELTVLVKAYPVKAIMAYDSIMPHSYFKELLPRLKEELPAVELFYEQKANISFSQMRQLKEARIEVIQPGIEALSSALLKRMNKGVTGGQNIATLRYARACGVSPNWNLLCAFPGDQRQDYQETLAWLPLLRHLTPPAILCQLNLDRFSPYFMQPARYGLRNLKPLSSYTEVLPKHAQVNKTAYRFSGDYDSAAFDYPTLIQEINQEIAVWRSLWVPAEEVHNPRLIRAPTVEDDERLPALHLTRVSATQYRLMDTRQLADTISSQLINYEQALAAVVSFSLPTLTLSQEVQQWALTHKVVIEMDDMLVPLATAPPELLAEFEQEAKTIRLRT